MLYQKIEIHPQNFMFSHDNIHTYTYPNEVIEIILDLSFVGLAAVVFRTVVLVDVVLPVMERSFLLSVLSQFSSLLVLPVPPSSYFACYFR